MKKTKAHAFSMGSLSFKNNREYLIRQCGHEASQSHLVAATELGLRELQNFIRERNSANSPMRFTAHGGLPLTKEHIQVLNFFDASVSAASVIFFILNIREYFVQRFLFTPFRAELLFINLNNDEVAATATDIDFIRRKT